MKTLFTGADILTLEAGKPVVLRNACLGVDGDRIDYVGTVRPIAQYDTTRDFTGKMLIPGLVNTHCHAAMTLLRGLGSDKPLDVWLTQYMFPTEDKLRPEDIRSGSYLAILEMLSTGTTSFTDMYYINDETIDACLTAGIRANIARPVQEFDPSARYEDSRRAKESFDLYRRRNGDGNGLIKIDFSIHAEYTCTEEIARRYCEEAKQYPGAGMHLHISETKKEHVECMARRNGKTPAQWFDSIGAFDGVLRPYAAHCVWATDEDIALFAERGVSVMHNPSSNMKLGSGFCPVEKMRAAGVNVTLGTDGAASNNNLNMFEELHLASTIHNGYMIDAEVMKPEYTLLMSTLNGAKLQGRDDTGALLAGYKADIVAVDMNKPHLYPNPEPMATLCYSAQGSDVCMTMVDGKVVYENGEFKTLDSERILYEAKRSCEYLYGKE
ncbi:MAG: amidohydrolase [Clostridia bacterium]|nr:amidohydrolase [Clostridia bacterium]